MTTSWGSMHSGHMDQLSNVQPRSLNAPSTGQMQPGVQYTTSLQPQLVSPSTLNVGSATYSNPGLSSSVSWSQSTLNSSAFKGTMEKPGLDRRDSKTAPITRSHSDEGPTTSTSHPAKLQRSITDPTADQAKGNDADAKAGRGKRLPHKLVERRYRLNLNGQIESLRLAIPSLKDYQSSGDMDEHGSSSKMLSKGVIISTAAQYIKELETERARLRENVAILMQQVESLRKLTRCDECPILDYLTDSQLGPTSTAMRVGAGARTMEGRFVPGTGGV